VKQPLAVRIHSDPAYCDVISPVGYLVIMTPIKEADYKRPIDTYGRERLGNPLWPP
jgi:hypothetical protein